ncbi:MAG: dual specificity protein phosphatase family protein [Armatimonadota bacterium]
MEEEEVINAIERHTEVYSKPGLPPFQYFSIGTNHRLWHGRNPLTAIDIETLANSCGITHILDLREPQEWASAGRFGGEAIAEIESCGIVRLNVPVKDTTPPGDADFANAVAFLDAAFALPDSRIYVHCRYGRERTGTVLMAWRALHDDTSCDAALAALNAEGAQLSPLPHQRLEAHRWVIRQRDAAAP